MRTLKFISKAFILSSLFIFVSNTQAEYKVYSTTEFGLKNALPEKPFDLVIDEFQLRKREGGKSFPISEYSTIETDIEILNDTNGYIMSLGGYKNLNWGIYDADLVQPGLIKDGDTIYFNIRNGINNYYNDFRTGPKTQKIFDLSDLGISYGEKFKMKVVLNDTEVKVYVNDVFMNSYQHPQKIIGEVRDYNDDAYIDYLNILGTPENQPNATGLKATGHSVLHADINFYNLKLTYDNR